MFRPHEHAPVTTWQHHYTRHTPPHTLSSTYFISHALYTDTDMLLLAGHVQWQCHTYTHSTRQCPNCTLHTMPNLAAVAIYRQCCQCYNALSTAPPILCTTSCHLGNVKSRTFPFGHVVRRQVSRVDRVNKKRHKGGGGGGTTIHRLPTQPLLLILTPCIHT